MRGAKVQPFFEFAKLFEKIVLIDSFCTAPWMPKCSHRSTMLRFRPLAWNKNSSIISDFFVQVVLIDSFCTAQRMPKMLT